MCIAQEMSLEAALPSMVGQTSPCLAPREAGVAAPAKAALTNASPEWVASETASEDQPAPADAAHLSLKEAVYAVKFSI